MTQTALVTEILPNGKAVVQVQRQSACGHSCADCASRCAHVEQTVLAEAENTCAAAAGDTVEVYSSTKKVLSAAALVYLVPVLLFVLAVAVTYSLRLSDGLCALISVAFFLLGVGAAVIYNRKVAAKRSITYKIVKILR